MMTEHRIGNLRDSAMTRKLLVLDSTMGTKAWLGRYGVVCAATQRGWSP